ncbi:hypothetical protein GCM10023094_15080 [Rhodococcus olei]|uniref:SMP-30/Gluconolactonase/LRE-like region domain-containing protein n=1 Tax=Rhodococcus olei TaxID=2161675 RepID=A0ABP8NZE4_9NOCA
MTLSRVAMVGAVVAGVVVGAPLAAAQPVPVEPALPPLPVQIPPVPQPVLPPIPGAAPSTTAAPTTTATPSTPAVAVAPATSVAVAPATSAATTTTSAASTTVAPAAACTSWKVSTVADGFGVLENLAFDGRGAMLLSESPAFGDGAIRTLTPAGTKGTLVSDVASPGGITVRGGRVLFTTGDNVMAGLYNGTNGTVESVGLDGGDRTTVARGLTMPNGLAALPDGDLLVTQALGDRPGLTRIPATDPSEPERVRTDIGSANGLFVSPDGSTVYVGNTFDKSTELRALDAANLTGDVTTVTLPGPGPANAGDDLTVGSDGSVYMALNGAGKVVRVDPATGNTCEIATGLPLTSSVRFGAGAGWDPASLYTTGFDGSVHRLTPPAS